MRKSRPISFGNNVRFAIIIDGDCEFWYLQMLLRNERSINVALKPEIPQKKKLREQFEKVTEQSKYYDKVIWIVDYDVINKETRLAKKGTETPAQEFKKYVLELEKDYKNVIVIINNPCFEFWILLHFEPTGKYYDDCESAIKRLKKYLPDYEKASKYFTKQGNDIYLRLKPKLKTAIANAAKLKDFDLDHPHNAVTQMQRLFEIEELKSIIDKYEVNHIPGNSSR
jgi:hypothetical protein